MQKFLPTYTGKYKKRADLYIRPANIIKGSQICLDGIVAGLAAQRLKYFGRDGSMKIGAHWCRIIKTNQQI